ncbi:hypothetical protein BIY29_11410 [Brenneria alni]|uniref:Uncharacterized protein n=1 Tax=Brenneria alni TaxID=71656 RepID=A0A421DMX8_9GAMM|nr:hypothetical protein BIY29_11410 [Brenneria alni]
MKMEVADKVACKPEIHGPSVPRGAQAVYAATPPQHTLPDNELCQQPECRPPQVVGIVFNKYIF